MVKIKDQIGENAGKLWVTLHKKGPLTESELIKKTGLSTDEMYAAIGWLAREHKMYKRDEFFSVDESYFHQLDAIKNSLAVSHKSSMIQEHDVKPDVSSSILKTTEKTSYETIVDHIDSTENFFSMNTKDKPNSFFQEKNSDDSNIIQGHEIDLKSSTFEEQIINNSQIHQEDPNTEHEQEPLDSSVMINDSLQENTSFPSFDLKDFSEETCDLCKKTIDLEHHLSGLVVSNEFFACEKCCQQLTTNDLMEWTQSRMQKPGDVRPIGLWVTQEKNKDRSILKK